MKCPDCGAEMKPLATSVYCPNDCDRAVQEEIDPEKTPRVIFWEYDKHDHTSAKADDDGWGWIDDIDWNLPVDTD